MLGLAMPVRMTADPRASSPRRRRRTSAAHDKVLPECTASDTRPTLPLARPVNSLSAMSAQAAHRHERRAPLWRHGGSLRRQQAGCVERPAVRDTLSSCSPRSSNKIPGPRNEIANSARHEHFVGLGDRRHPSADVTAIPARPRLPPHDLSPCSPHRPEPVAGEPRRGCATQSESPAPGRRTSRHPVAGGVLQRAVVQPERPSWTCARSARARSPPVVAEPARPLGRAGDVHEEQPWQAPGPLPIPVTASPVTNSSIAPRKIGLRQRPVVGSVPLEPLGLPRCAPRGISRGRRGRSR